MSSVRMSASAFRAAYRELLKEILRLAGPATDSSEGWVADLLQEPLSFPPQLEKHPRFATVKAEFRKLASAATGDASALEAIARQEIRLALGAVPSLQGRGSTEPLSTPGERDRGVHGSPDMGRGTRGGPRASPGVPKGPILPPPSPILWDGGGLLGVEGREPTPAALPPPEESPALAPEARYLNAGIAGHAADQPLDVDQTYVLELGIDLESSGDASERIPDEGVLFAAGEEIIELTLQVESADFDVAQGPTPLKLPRRGRSRGKARFDVTPKKEGRGTLTATLHKQGNFLLQMEISYSVGKTAAAPPSMVTHGRTIDAAAGLRPRELTLVVRPTGGGYDCTVIGAVSRHVVLPITEAYVADAIAEARAAMMQVVTQRDARSRLVFQTGIDIDSASQETALRTLARAGAALFQRLFYGPAAGTEVQEVGDLLRARATQPGVSLNLQIVPERFPVPWGLMYMGEVAQDAILDWDLFLGMRHVIEQIPLQPKMTVADAVIKSDAPALAVSVNVNAGIDAAMRIDVVARQLEFWEGRARAFGERMQVAKRRSRADLLAALNGAAADQLMYLFCHAITANPGDPGGINGSCLVLTDDERLTLGDLNLDAPMTKPLGGNPLVFINACESAELTTAFYDGFVPYFMAKGARGVVGTECKTPALFAAEWALRFFPRFLAGEPLGALFLALRRDLSAQHGNPLGLLYAVYCDGDTQIQPGLSA